MRAMLFRQRRPRDDVLVHADRALDLAAPAVEIAEREMRLDGVVVDLDHAQEDFERLVGLFVEKERQTLEIAFRRWSLRIGRAFGARRAGPGTCREKSC